MKQCLVVDHSRVIRTVAKRILESLDFETREAEDGLQGLRACRERMPDLIFVDGHAPAMTTIEFLQSVRRHAGGTRPVILVCTTESNPDHIAEAMAAGADEYLVKPYDGACVRAKLVQVGMTAPF